jgi:hypothetical protein
MNERFNFYDIYGYLLPGGLLFVLLWLPFGLLLDQWPPTSWSSAVLVLGLAYIAGHLLHALSEAAFPSKFKDGEGNNRQPSDLLVDSKDDKVIQSRYRLGDMKKNLADQIDHLFGIKIEINASWTKELGIRRSVAFFKCRGFLTKQKAAAYAEQQQGMYALMRGTGAAFVLACALYLGVAIGSWFDIRLTSKGLFVVSFIFLALNLFAALCSLLYPQREETTRKASFWLLAIVLLCIGMITSKVTKVVAISDVSLPSKLESSLKTNDDPAKYIEKEQVLLNVRQSLQILEHETGLMFALSMIAAVLSLLCLSAFRAFAANFASTVYRDFSMYADTA